MTAEDRSRALVALFVKHGLVTIKTKADRSAVESATSRAIAAAVTEDRREIARFVKERST